MHNELSSRKNKYYLLNTLLSSIDSNKLKKLLDKDINKKSWGKIHLIKLDKSKVFVKRIPLTELEYQNMFSTKNLYNLPTFYNYGVGSAGFGAFRELVTHIKTTNWVLEGKCENFPLMYHYRIVPCEKVDTDIDVEKHSEYIKKWNNDEYINNYILARNQAKYEIILFLEYIPHVISKWLEKNPNKLMELYQQVSQTIAFLKSNGIIHFDIHFGNILTDGEKMYVTDFGLTLDKSFDLNQVEKVFFRNNVYYDYGEFFSSIAFYFFSICKKYKKIEKYLSNTPKQYEQFIFFLNNLDKIDKMNLLKNEKPYFTLLKQYYDVNVMFHSFYITLSRNNKKDTKYNHTRLKKLLNNK